MNTKSNWLLGLLLVMTSQVFAQLTINVTSIPSNTPAGDDIYIAGSFNNWSPNNASYKLTAGTSGNYSITFTPPTGALAYKFTRGSWSTVEGNATGGFQPDHTYTYNGGAATINIPVLSWEDQGAGEHTATQNVSIMEEDFYMPQFNRSRRIWVYLPPDYNSTSKDYPVLYMHDGQNLFDAFYSFSGEWGIDESMDEAFEDGDYGCIIVGIDNGGADRLAEYTPYAHPNYGGGDGEKHAAFVVNTLKPYIDANYRTLPERDFTGIGGSSLGGLISMYTAIEYQDVFSKVCAFSPSFWFNDSSYVQVQNIGKEQDMKFYMLAGGNEESGNDADDVVNKVIDMKAKLLAVGFETNEILSYLPAYGQHNEAFWKNEFPAAYEWLFGDLVLATEVATKLNVYVYPNPTDSMVQIKIDAGALEAFLYDTAGKLILQRAVSAGQNIDIHDVPSGLYILKVLNKAGDELYVGKLVKR